jgi:protein-L-isoaspartate(D-aspartate) O-methyltransferase
MVENQLRPNRVDDQAILEAMLLVRREAFVPPALQAVAYGDDDLDLGDGQRLIEPLALGKLLQAAGIRASDLALVVGCDTGYVAAVLAKLAARVFLLLPPGRAVEPIQRMLAGVGCSEVVAQTGPLAAGLPSRAPFDLILLAGAVPAVPDVLLDQLAENGRLAAVVQQGVAGQVTICRKISGSIGRVTPFDAWLPELAAFRPAPRFVF